MRIISQIKVTPNPATKDKKRMEWNVKDTERDQPMYWVRPY